MTCLTGGLTASGRTYSGWVNHPAVRMWRGHEGALMRYQDAVCQEWLDRGYRDTCLGKTFDAWAAAGGPGSDQVELGNGAVLFTPHVPPWLGDPLLHESHRSNLLRKDPAYYAAMRDTTREGLEYVWPA